MQLPVATPEDLIFLKLEASRPIDIEDVLELETACGAALDLAYLRRWAATLDLQDRVELYFEDMLSPRGEAP